MTNLSIEQKRERLTLDRLKALMNLHSDGLCLFVNGIVKNNETAEELVSDIFVKIWNKRDQFPTIRNIKSYLFILARNESISHIRKNNKIKTIPLDDLGDYYFTPLESDGSEFFEQEIVDKINAAIELLPSKCKMAFSLAKLSGLKYKEIAEIMQISPLTVKNHIATALNKIYNRIGHTKNGHPISMSDIYLFLFTRSVILE